MERLQKFLSNAGIASRRKCEEIIKSGVVYVNGIKTATLGTVVDPENDDITVNGKKINKKEDFIYILLNKPTGYITSVKDQFGRPTVMDLIKSKNRLYPVGRLDYDTSGLLIVTNDGLLTYKITHPKHEISKTYYAKVSGIPTLGQLSSFRNGLFIDDYKTSPAQIEIIHKYKNTSLLKIIIHEGKNRQIRKMCSKIGHPVIDLSRKAIGDITIDGLKEGSWRYLKPEEIEYLISI